MNSASWMILLGKYLVIEGMSLWNYFNITACSCHLSIYVICRNGNTYLTPLDVHPELLFFYHFKRRTVHNMSLKYGFSNSAASMKCAVFNYFASVSTLWLSGWTRVLFVCVCMYALCVCSAFGWLCFRFICFFSLIFWSTFVVNKGYIYIYWLSK